MSNKTCGECKWFSESGNRCQLFINQYIFGDRAACNNFAAKKPTNGDVIRQMSNDKLATFLAINAMCDNCPAESASCGRGSNVRTCRRAWLNLLNAPADCVKQNGNHDTQTDLCCPDNTQDQEVKDE